MPIECWDCKRNYENSAVITLEYECRLRKHSITVCLNCAQKHEYCRIDGIKLTLDSESELNEKLEDDSINREPVNESQ